MQCLKLTIGISWRLQIGHTSSPYSLKCHISVKLVQCQLPNGNLRFKPVLVLGGLVTRSTSFRALGSILALFWYIHVMLTNVTLKLNSSLVTVTATPRHLRLENVGLQITSCWPVPKSSRQIQQSMSHTFHVLLKFCGHDSYLLEKISK